MQTSIKGKAKAGAAADYRGLARAGYALAVLTFGVLGGWAVFAPPDILGAPDPLEVEPVQVVARAETKPEPEIPVNPADASRDAQASPRDAEASPRDAEASRSEAQASPRVEAILAPLSAPEASEPVASAPASAAAPSAEREDNAKGEPASERASIERPVVERPAVAAITEERPSSEQDRPTETRSRSVDATPPAVTSRSRKRAVKIAQVHRGARAPVAVSLPARSLPRSTVTVLIGYSSCSGH
jgi:hypothetical protein